MEPKLVHSCRSLFRFRKHEAARSISTSPGRDASPSQVTSPQFVRFFQQFASTHLYTWVERGTVRVKCLAQEHNTMSPARAQTRTTRSGVERTNHEATAPPNLWSPPYKLFSLSSGRISLKLFENSINNDGNQSPVNDIREI